jgi:hypothetical protein
MLASTTRGLYELTPRSEVLVMQAAKASDGNGMGTTGQLPELLALEQKGVLRLVAIGEHRTVYRVAEGCVLLRGHLPRHAA